MRIGDKVHFIISLTDEIVRENGYNSSKCFAELEAKESGAFSYGNGSVTVLTLIDPTDKCTELMYDTRYARGSFADVSKDILETFFGANASVISQIGQVENDRG